MLLPGQIIKKYRTFLSANWVHLKILDCLKQILRPQLSRSLMVSSIKTVSQNNNNNKKKKKKKKKKTQKRFKIQ
jgi:hypothetical protein